MESNRILPILGIIVLFMLIFIGVKSCSSDNQQTVGLSEIPKAGKPDADSPADTIRTLTAEVAALKSENLKVQQQNEELLHQRESIAQQVKQELLTRIEQKTEEQQSGVMSTLTRQIDFLKTRLEEMSQAQNQAAAQQPSGDIPIGFGLSGSEQLPGVEGNVIWVEPLGTKTDDEGKPVYIPTEPLTDGGLLSQVKDKASDTKKYLDAGLEELSAKNTPVYTVPRNATLIGSTGMTALIGRIPRGGVVEDPFPFKVIVGKDNLAANGIEIPGLDGMIFSGKSSGDWTLSCVRGKLYSMTAPFAPCPPIFKIRTRLSSFRRTVPMATAHWAGFQTAGDTVCHRHPHQQCRHLSGRPDSGLRCGGGRRCVRPVANHQHGISSARRE